MKQTWPLVGRSHQLSLVRRALTSDTPQAIVLAGAPGVGKTRLARQALAMARDDGFAVSVVTASKSAAQTPLGAFAPLLGGPEFDSPRSSSPATGRAAMLRQATNVLLETAGPRPLLVFVDDAHLLDETSATLVHQLASEQAAVVLVTVVAGAVAPDAIVALWKDELGIRIEVPPLSREDTEKLVRAALTGPVDGATAVEFARVCEGNALYLRELLIGAIANGTLRADSGLWRLHGPLTPSGRLVELIESRLQALSDVQRQTLEIIAFAQSLSPRILRKVADLRVAAELERHGLLVAEHDNDETVIRLSHPIYAEVVRAGTPALRTVEIAHQLADAVEADGVRTDDDVLRVATWRLIDGEARGDLFLAAARIARWRYDFALAERLAAAAAKAGAGHEARFLLAQLSGLQGDARREEQLLAPLLEKETDDRRYSEMALHRIEASAFHVGDLDAAIRIADEALSRLRGTPYQLEVEARRTTLTFATEGPRAALVVALPLLDRARDEAHVWVSLAASQSAAADGQLTRAIEIAKQGLHTQRSMRHRARWYPCFHITQQCDALYHLGRFCEADELASDNYRIALDERCCEAQAAFALELAKPVADRGRPDRAARYAREAAEIYRSLGRPQFELWARQYLTLALALCGLVDEAAKEWENLLDLNIPVNHIMVIDRFQAHAWLHVARGDLATAREIMHEAAEFTAASGDRVGEAIAWHVLARLGEAPAAAPRLAELARSIEGDLVRARSAHATGLARGDADLLEEASRRFADLGADLVAAEAAAEAAQCWRQRGRRHRASACELRAGQLAERAGKPNTPALDTSGSWARLTEAERRVATRVAQGRSNRTVAEELHLSVRTVESHLQRVYRKLNIRTRAELAGALGWRTADAD